MRVDRLFRDARLATMAGTGADHGLGLIEDGLIATEGGRIVYVGTRADAPRLDPVETIRCEGRWITPASSTATPTSSMPATAPTNSRCG